MPCGRYYYQLHDFVQVHVDYKLTMKRGCHKEETFTGNESAREAEEERFALL